MRRGAPHNLPIPVSSFVGRTDETRAVLGLLASRPRLVTLTGTGGVGKTRLAQEVAWQLVENEAVDDGIWWVELAALADGRLVPQAVATTLGLREESDTPFAEVVIGAVRTRRVLLVLDNCEHLIDTCAQLAHELLRACPNLTLLATSREPLRTQGETAWHVAPLACPDPAVPSTVERLREFDAVRLFTERASGASERFRLTDRNSPAVARVCQRLDGIPLALELAAARVRVLSVEQIAARLDDCFGVLAEGSRTAPQRQRTLEAAVAWSYDLLTPAEKRLFNRVAVFRGTWTLEAAEAICGDPEVGLVLDTLSHLVEKSLVVVDEGPHGASLYRMPETIRQFAAARLLASGESPLLRERHFRWYVEFGLEAEQALRFTQLPWTVRRPWMERLNLEIANLRAAWRWPLDGDGSPNMGLQLVAGLFPMFWTGIGMLAEGIDSYTALLERDRGAAPTPARAWALATASKLAAQYGNDDLADRWTSEYLSLPADLQTPRASGFVHNALGLVALHRDDLARSREEVLLALDAGRMAGDRQGVALFLGYLGGVAEAGGQFDEAETVYQDSVDSAREIDFPIAVGLGLAGLARLAHRRGEHALARRLYQQAQRALADMGAMPQIAQLLDDLGHIELECGNWSDAATRFGECLELAVQLGSPDALRGALQGLGVALVAGEGGTESRQAGLRLVGASLFTTATESTAQSSTVSAAVRRGELVLGRERTASLVDEGRALGLDEATALARTALVELPRASAPAIDPTVARLSRREQEVLSLLARGASNRGIADALVIAERTAEMHVSNILAKLGLSGRAQVAAWAAEQQLKEPALAATRAARR